MPPIFGILNTKLQSVDSGMIARMTHAAKYIYSRQIRSNEIRGGYLASAVTLVNPLVAEDDTVSTRNKISIVADAALYKRDALIKRLGNQSELSNVSDAALILQAYIKWGGECVKFLYGDFSFVIFNSDTGQLFAGRDHLGVRPLFYYMCDDSFIFSSELRIVKDALPVKAAIRQDYLLDTLVTVKTEKDLTPFENIYRLNPAHYLQIADGNIKIQSYWNPDPDKKIRFGTEEEYIEAFREKLVHAVNQRCSGGAKTGAELSGGLDSSAVTGMASDYLKPKGATVHSFSNLFPENTGIEFTDERKFIEVMNACKPMEWKGISWHKSSIPVLLQQAINIQGCFVQQNFNVFSQSLYETAAESEIQTLLSGFGGDELVSARTSMPWNELIHDMHWRVILDEIFYKGITFKTLVKPVLIASRYVQSRIHRKKFSHGVFTPELLDGRFANLPLQPGFSNKHKLRERLGDNFEKLKRGTLSWRQYDRIMMDHLPQRMEYCYAMAAQYGIEYRYPLLDVDLVETALAFPPWLKQHHGINRYLFRQAIRGFVPEEIRNRDDKSGSTIPQTLFSLSNEREEILNIVREAGNSPFLNEIFDLSRFPEWYEKMVKRDKKDMNYLMPGAFYDYLMIMLYFKDSDKRQGTRDEEEE